MMIEAGENGIFFDVNEADCKNKRLLDNPSIFRFVPQESGELPIINYSPYVGFSLLSMARTPHTLANVISNMISEYKTHLTFIMIY